MEDVAIYFEQQRKLEYSKRSLVETILTKFSKAVRTVYILLSLRVKILKNLSFYYN